MSAKNLRKMVVMMVIAVCVSAGFVRADKMALQEKLSKEVKIQLKDVTIAEVLEEIGEKAGVKFVLSDKAVWKLPYGEATRLSVAMDGPLAESMTEMLNAFFMRYAVGREVITIYPRAELEHILGRPTAGQLELLKKMYTMVFIIGRAGSAGAALKSMIGEVFPDVVIVPVEYYLELSRIAEELTEGLPEGRQSAPMTLPQMLDSIGDAWYLSGMDFPNKITEIRIVSWEDFIFAKLDQIVDISFEEEKREVIIQRLANWTGMELVVKKGETSWLDEEISVDMQNIKLQQAIRNIVTTVNGRVEIDIRVNEIHVSGPKSSNYRTRAARARPSSRTTTAASPARRASEGYVGKISIPMDGGKYYIEFMLRESDLTEELKKLRQEKMTEILGERPKPKGRRPKPAAEPAAKK